MPMGAYRIAALDLVFLTADRCDVSQAGGFASLSKGCPHPVKTSEFRSVPLPKRDCGEYHARRGGEGNGTERGD